VTVARARPPPPSSSRPTSTPRAGPHIGVRQALCLRATPAGAGAARAVVHTGVVVQRILREAGALLAQPGAGPDRNRTVAPLVWSAAEAAGTQPRRAGPGPRGPSRSPWASSSSSRSPRSTEDASCSPRGRRRWAGRSMAGSRRSSRPQPPRRSRRRGLARLRRGAAGVSP
jgi:hypothetical protein